MTRSEYDANRNLDSVKYSAAWMHPSKHVYRRKTDSWFKRLIRWIAGH